jgi:hypothetical protein
MHTVDWILNIPERRFLASTALAAADDAASQGRSALDWGSLPGLDPAADALLKTDRAQRKREQLESLLHLLQVHILPHLTQDDRNTQRPLRFVDFACGSGHFGLLVASQVPGSQVALVDMQDHGLEKARDRAESLGIASRVTTCALPSDIYHCGLQSHESIGAGCGSIGDYQDNFDCALGLHSCGSLTDLILAQVKPPCVSYCAFGRLTAHLSLGQAVSRHAAFCVAPCCCKLRHCG